jgi:fructose-1,6-bisphosphatase/inositol monophosphatase family enzyme
MNEHLEFAKRLARDAGAVMLEYFNQCDISHYKADNTIVTTADTKINQMVIDRVRQAYPDHGVYGEEDSFGRDRKELWACDPIDGTAMFARGVPTAVFSLAFVVDGEPQVGVVYNPFVDQLFFAAKENGAYMNDKKIFVNSMSLGNQRAFFGFDTSRTALFDVIKVADIIHQSGVRSVCLGSVAYDAVLVAAGCYNTTIFPGYKKGKNVDIAAAKIIVEEAGGRVTDIYGNDQRYDRDIKGAIVSNGIVHDEIIEIIREGLK